MTCVGLYSPMTWHAKRNSRAKGRNRIKKKTEACNLSPQCVGMIACMHVCVCVCVCVRARACVCSACQCKCSTLHLGLRSSFSWCYHVLWFLAPHTHTHRFANSQHTFPTCLPTTACSHTHTFRLAHAMLQF